MTRLRSAGIVVLLAGSMAAAFTFLPTVAALVTSGIVAVGGIFLFRRPAACNFSLLVASSLLGFAGIEATFGVLAPPPVNRDVVKVYDPADWNIADPAVGYRPKPGVSTDVIATYRDEEVYRRTYHIAAGGERVTPGTRPDGPTFLFIGDSCIFGEGLTDGETLPAQFARLLGGGQDGGGHVVNLGVLGYAPNHLVRALETGLYDTHATGKVAAVVTWITPRQLQRVIGIGGWLGTSPRYVLDDHGRLKLTGTFYGHRLGDPLAGASYLLRNTFAALRRAAAPVLEQEQAALYVALLARLKELVRQRYDAPLVLVYDWPDQVLPGQNDLQYLPTFNAIKALGMPMVSIRRIIGPSEMWPRFFIAHDGHPNAHLATLAARDLADVLAAGDKQRAGR
jgi:hypothetical protein